PKRMGRGGHAGKSNFGAAAAAAARRNGWWSGTMRRFLCLWFPRWQTDRWQRQHNAPPGPLALTASGQGGIRLTAVDRSAARLGLSVGMTLADARALVPSL